MTYTSPNSTGSLAFTPTSNQFGSATITVTVKDNGGTAGGGVDTVTRTFTVTVDPVNDAPTLDPIPDPATIQEDAGLQTINMNGISAGPNENQAITITAVSSNPGLIPNPTVNYTSPNSTGTLTYTPLASQSGSATITVTVRDNGGTANGGIDTVTRSFTVTVNPVNDAPTLDTIADPVAILEGSGAQTVNFAGTSAGPNETQALTVSAVSSNPSLIPNPAVTYTSANATGSLTFTPIADQFGSATITVTVRDDGGTANGGVDQFVRTFNVTVTPVNDAPTLDAIPSPVPIRSDAGIQTVNLAGISAGPFETQVLKIAATSDNPSLIANPVVNYTSANPTGTLTYTPLGNQAGKATITVTVTDDGGTQNGGVDTTSRTFVIDVIVANLTPTLDAITNPAAINEDSPTVSINLTGISAGGSESQPLAITTSSDNTGLIPVPTVTYSSPQSTGTLSYAPIANQSGSAIIKVIVEDGGLDGKLSTANDNATTSRQFTVTVNAVNDPPIAASDSFNLNQGAVTVLDLLANDSDIDSTINANSFEFKSGPVGGTVSINNGKVEYRPNQTFFGQDSFSYRVADAEGSFSDFANVKIAVNAIPVAVGEEKYLNASGPTNVDIVANDSDPDGANPDLQIIIVNAPDPSIGQFAITPQNLVRFTPGQAFTGLIQLRYRLRDAQGAESPEAIAQLGVYNQNPTLREDVNGSGQISALDALFVINTLNVLGGRQIPPSNRQAPYYDVSADGFVTALDALMVINYLNTHPNGEGERTPLNFLAPSDSVGVEDGQNRDSGEYFARQPEIELLATKPVRLANKPSPSWHIAPSDSERDGPFDQPEESDHAAIDEVYSSLVELLAANF